jgi:Kdo2-lipid IVA lauroyltransferase/acyltransferase
MRKSKRRTQLEYILVRTLLALFGALPLGVGLRLGPAIGSLAYFWANGRLRRTAKRNLQLAFPDLNDRRREELLRGSFRNFGRLLAVFSHFNNDANSLKAFVDCDGLEHLDRARTNGHGVVLFTGHLGAWELTSFALALFDRPLSFLVRRIDNPKIEKLVERARTRLGNRTVDKRSAAREMLQTLRAGETLGILVDLNTHEREGIFVDFFGVPASTTFVLAKLAVRTGASVLPVFAPWDQERRRFVVKIDEPLPLPQSGDEEKDVRQLTQSFTKVIEKYVRLYPDQWLWIHRRWKTRPPGSPPVY